MIKLLEVSVLDLQGFRLNLAIVLINADNNVLLAKRIRQNAWQFPQGGLNEDESLLDGLYRELNEETGLEPKDVSVISSTKYWLKYKIPLQLRRENDPLFVGQKQKWFLLKFHGPDSKIRFDLSAKPEFDSWKWVSYWYPLRVIVDFKKQVYRKALRELAFYIPNSSKQYDHLDELLL